MNPSRRLLPQPAVSAAILALWLALAPRPSLGQAVLGALLALALPFLTRRFWPGHPKRVQPWPAFRLLLRVLFDIVVANLQVARLILGPRRAWRPGFLEIPLDQDDIHVATALASIVSLTPGSVSIDIDRVNRLLHVHALDVDDPKRMIAVIKTRYEKPLKEIFGC